MEYHIFCDEKCPLNEKNRCQIIDYPCPVVGYVRHLVELDKSETSKNKGV